MVRQCLYAYWSYKTKSTLRSSARQCIVIHTPELKANAAAAIGDQLLCPFWFITWNLHKQICQTSVSICVNKANVRYKNLFIHIQSYMSISFTILLDEYQLNMWVCIVHGLTEYEHKW